MRTLAALGAAAATCALAAAPAGTATAEAPQPSPLIVGGGKASAEGWSFAVALRLKRFGYLCAGSLIAPDAVLTAAHCVKGIKRRRLRVIAGSPWAAGGRAGVSIPARRVRVDPHYRPRRSIRDLAVIRLARPAPGGVVALPTAAESRAATKRGQPLHSAGWGARSVWGYRLAKRLKATRELALPNGFCRAYFGGRGYEAASMICALGPRSRRLEGLNTTSCSGDSGGPLVTDRPDGPRIVGVVSAGPIPCGAAPSIYARVSAGLNFIRRELG